MDLERYVGEVPASAKLSMAARISRHMKLTARSLPDMLGFRKPLVGFRNVPDAAPTATN